MYLALVSQRKGGRTRIKRATVLAGGRFTASAGGAYVLRFI